MTEQNNICPPNYLCVTDFNKDGKADENLTSLLNGTYIYCGSKNGRPIYIHQSIERLVIYYDVYQQRWMFTIDDKLVVEGPKEDGVTFDYSSPDLIPSDHWTSGGSRGMGIMDTPEIVSGFCDGFIPSPEPSALPTPSVYPSPSPTVEYETSHKQICVSGLSGENLSEAGRKHNGTYSAKENPSTKVLRYVHDEHEGYEITINVKSSGAFFWEIKRKLGASPVTQFVSTSFESTSLESASKISPSNFVYSVAPSKSEDYEGNPLLTITNNFCGGPTPSAPPPIVPCPDPPPTEEDLCVKGLTGLLASFNGTYKHAGWDFAYNLSNPQEYERVDDNENCALKVTFPYWEKIIADKITARISYVSSGENQRSWVLQVHETPIIQQTNSAGTEEAVSVNTRHPYFEPYGNRQSWEIMNNHKTVVDAAVNKGPRWVRNGAYRSGTTLFVSVESVSTSTSDNKYFLRRSKPAIYPNGVSWKRYPLSSTHNYSDYVENSEVPVVYDCVETSPSPSTPIPLIHSIPCELIALCIKGFTGDYAMWNVPYLEMEVTSEDDIDDIWTIESNPYWNGPLADEDVPWNERESVYDDDLEKRVYPDSPLGIHNEIWLSKQIYTDEENDCETFADLITLAGYFENSSSNFVGFNYMNPHIRRTLCSFYWNEENQLGDEPTENDLLMIDAAIVLSLFKKDSKIFWAFWDMSTGYVVSQSQEFDTGDLPPYNNVDNFKICPTEDIFKPYTNGITVESKCPRPVVSPSPAPSVSPSPSPSISTIADLPIYDEFCFAGIERKDSFSYDANGTYNHDGWSSNATVKVSGWGMPYGYPAEPYDSTSPIIYGSDGSWYWVRAEAANYWKVPKFKMGSIPDPDSAGRSYHSEINYNNDSKCWAVTIIKWTGQHTIMMSDPVDLTVETRKIDGKLRYAITPLPWELEKAPWNNYEWNIFSNNSIDENTKIKTTISYPCKICLSGIIHNPTGDESTANGIYSLSSFEMSGWGGRPAWKGPEIFIPNANNTEVSSAYWWIMPERFYWTIKLVDENFNDISKIAYCQELPYDENVAWKFSLDNTDHSGNIQVTRTLFGCPPSPIPIPSPSAEPVIPPVTVLPIPSPSVSTIKDFCITCMIAANGQESKINGQYEYGGYTDGKPHYMMSGVYLVLINDKGTNESPTAPDHFYGEVYWDKKVNKWFITMRGNTDTGFPYTLYTSSDNVDHPGLCESWVPDKYNTKQGSSPKIEYGACSLTCCVSGIYEKDGTYSQVNGIYTAVDTSQCEEATYIPAPNVSMRKDSYIYRKGPVDWKTHASVLTNKGLVFDDYAWEDVTLNNVVFQFKQYCPTNIIGKSKGIFGGYWCLEVLNADTEEAPTSLFAGAGQRNRVIAVSPEFEGSYPWEIPSTRGLQRDILEKTPHWNEPDRRDILPYWRLEAMNPTHSTWSGNFKQTGEMSVRGGCTVIDDDCHLATITDPETVCLQGAVYFKDDGTPVSSSLNGEYVAYERKDGDVVEYRQPRDSTTYYYIRRVEERESTLYPEYTGEWEIGTHWPDESRRTVIFYSHRKTPYSPMKVYEVPEDYWQMGSDGHIYNMSKTTNFVCVQPKSGSSPESEDHEEWMGTYKYQKSDIYKERIALFGIQAAGDYYQFGTKIYKQINTTKKDPGYYTRRTMQMWFDTVKDGDYCVVTDDRETALWGTALGVIDLWRQGRWCIYPHGSCTIRTVSGRFGPDYIDNATPRFGAAPCPDERDSQGDTPLRLGRDGLFSNLNTYYNDFLPAQETWDNCKVTRGPCGIDLIKIKVTKGGCPDTVPSPGTEISPPEVTWPPPLPSPEAPPLVSPVPSVSPEPVVVVSPSPSPYVSPEPSPGPFPDFPWAVSTICVSGIKTINQIPGTNGCFKHDANGEYTLQESLYNGYPHYKRSVQQNAGGSTNVIKNFEIRWETNYINQSVLGHPAIGFPTYILTETNGYGIPPLYGHSKGTVNLFESSWSSGTWANFDEIAFSRDPCPLQELCVSGLEYIENRFFSGDNIPVNDTYRESDSLTENDKPVYVNVNNSNYRIEFHVGLFDDYWRLIYRNSVGGTEEIATFDGEGPYPWTPPSARGMQINYDGFVGGREEWEGKGNYEKYTGIDVTRSQMILECKSCPETVQPPPYTSPSPITVELPDCGDVLQNGICIKATFDAYDIFSIMTPIIQKGEISQDGKSLSGTWSLLAETPDMTGHRPDSSYPLVFAMNLQSRGGIVSVGVDLQDIWWEQRDRQPSGLDIDICERSLWNTEDVIHNADYLSHVQHSDSRIGYLLDKIITVNDNFRGIFLIDVEINVDYENKKVTLKASRNIGPYIINRNSRSDINCTLPEKSIESSETWIAFNPAASDYSPVVDDKVIISEVYNNKDCVSNMCFSDYDGIIAPSVSPVPPEPSCPPPDYICIDGIIGNAFVSGANGTYTAVGVETPEDDCPCINGYLYKREATINTKKVVYYFGVSYTGFDVSSDAYRNLTPKEHAEAVFITGSTVNMCKTLYINLAESELTITSNPGGVFLPLLIATPGNSHDNTFDDCDEFLEMDFNCGTYNIRGSYEDTDPDIMATEIMGSIASGQLSITTNCSPPPTSPDTLAKCPCACYRFDGSVADSIGGHHLINLSDADSPLFEEDSPLDNHVQSLEFKGYSGKTHLLFPDSPDGCFDTRNHSLSICFWIRHASYAHPLVNQEESPKYEGVVTRGLYADESNQFSPVQGFSGDWGIFYRPKRDGSNDGSLYFMTSFEDGSTISMSTVIPDRSWHFYCFTIDLEEEKACITRSNTTVETISFEGKSPKYTESQQVYLGRNFGEHEVKGFLGSQGLRKILMHNLTFCKGQI